ncbi:hypothetical protein PQJ75_13980 [Rhodoplanes sp. TEM]|uniref:Uncharacterized protein n=1 Tax=Rhodoplanes tepidamans TaxID=200616 RepID=A0ABT5JFA5_RHOTP|nr:MULTISPECIES: hypothetical protein [Rhodoplanes]MDC7788001.1 hypothetical protein [Rhodoplanes tepidamans]MDC7984841.1 hypothetical protein [Rhodoplanes sp. TEM]MDQ0358430.1 hypothetical protein [Rhodoplanes tepidamans]
MTSPTTPPTDATIQRAGCAMGGNTVTLTLTCTTVPAARDLFRRLNAAVERGELTTLLRAGEVSP